MPIQIIPNNERRSFGEEVLSGLNAAQPGIQAFLDKREQQQKEQQEQLKKQRAFQQAGLDPSIANLPEAFQQAIAKQKFALPEKPMSKLQEAQQKLAEERTKALQGEQDLFNNYFGNNQGQQSDQTNQLDQTNQEAQGMPEQQQRQVDPNNPQSWPEDVLTKMAGFANQPGKRGVIGNIAKNEKDRRDAEKKAKHDQFLEDRKYNTEFSKKAEEEVEGIRNSLSKKEFSLNLHNLIDT